MVQTADQIEAHIRNARRDLEANINELEQRVKSVIDWRQQYRKYPGTFITVALTGGVLIALMTRGRKSAPSLPSLAPASARTESRISPPPRKAASEIVHSISDLTSALIGVATTQVTHLLSRWVPGFEDHMPGSAKHEAEKDAESAVGVACNGSGGQRGKATHSGNDAADGAENPVQ